ncbi:hypothetical protein [Streptomyces sp. NPDC089919]|uniref:hypothetical protein n=1 Tax=Streptomyces sp. NPDC089919 TaxID=3155188 RepID=UPI00343B8D36
MTARVIAPRPEPDGRRRVRCDGRSLGRAAGVRDLLEFLRRIGLDAGSIDLADSALIDWRGGGPEVWTHDSNPQ